VLAQLSQFLFTFLQLGLALEPVLLELLLLVAVRLLLLLHQEREAIFDLAVRLGQVVLVLTLLAGPLLVALGLHLRELALLGRLLLVPGTALLGDLLVQLVQRGRLDLDVVQRLQLVALDADRFLDVLQLLQPLHHLGRQVGQDLLDLDLGVGDALADRVEAESLDRAQHFGLLDRRRTTILHALNLGRHGCMLP